MEAAIFQHDSEDSFNRLSDDLVLSIFNTLKDIKALGRCCMVSKRFNSMALQVDSILVRIDFFSKNSNSNGFLRDLTKSMQEIIINPDLSVQQFLHLFHYYRAEILPHISGYSVGKVLKNFKGIRTLQIELPSTNLNMMNNNNNNNNNGGAVFKCKAELGRSLESCVILFQNYPIFADKNQYKKQLIFIRWITKLFAFVLWRYLLQPIVKQHHPTLRSLVLMSADAEWMLSMQHEQMVTALSTNWELGQAYNLKWWYTPQLKLSSGFPMDSVMLVAFSLVDRPIRRELDEYVMCAFERGSEGVGEDRVIS